MSSNIQSVATSIKPAVYNIVVTVNGEPKKIDNIVKKTPTSLSIASGITIPAGQSVTIKATVVGEVYNFGQ